MKATQFDRVIVCGDLMRDYHIVKDRIPVSTYSAAGNVAIMQHSVGGAYYLKELIAAVCPDGLVDLVGPRIGHKGQVNEAYQVWEPCPRKKNDGKTSDDQVWRIKVFLGCRKSGESADLQPKVKDPSGNDLLVMDNLGLNFTTDHKAWKSLEPIAMRCGHIVVKSSTLNTASLFYRRLLPMFADKTTLVVSSTTLRETGIPLSRGLSWDRTIEETVNLFSPSSPLCDLASCCRIIVHFGLAGVAVFSRKASDQALRCPANQTKEWDCARLVRFLYSPTSHEGVIEEGIDGHMYGVNSLLTAAMVRHLVQPDGLPLFVACAAAMVTSRLQLESGGGEAKKPMDLNQLQTEIRKRFVPQEGNIDTSGFYCHFPRFSEEVSGGTYGFPLAGRVSPYGLGVNLLRDVAGTQSEAMAALATEIILRGPETSLGGIPMVRFGKYLTVDREEIERINAFRRAVIHYHNNDKEIRPLSIAVFGQPGSGKSFAIKEVMKDLFGRERKTMTFNLSQMEHAAELVAVLHLVHDETLRGSVPLVFFDEFDAQKCRWLKEFLMPMQDSAFWDGHAEHPLGKAVFVFAGGTCFSFADFNQREKNGKFSDTNRESKVPDFISRLRGHIDVKGVNVTSTLDSQVGTHMVRRALVLRYELEESCLRIINPKTKLAAIGLDVIRSFLFARNFEHGARSISALVSTSRLGDQNRFTAACLPPPDVLAIHLEECSRLLPNQGQTVSTRRRDEADFFSPPHPEYADPELIEELARSCHEAWKKEKEKGGYKLDKTRNDDPAKGHLTHPRLMPYEDLPEAWKADNRKPARFLLLKTAMAGYRLKRLLPGVHPHGFSSRARAVLAKLEHDFWVRDRLLSGHEFAPVTADPLRRHRCMQAFTNLKVADRALDDVIVGSIPMALAQCGYCLVPEKGVAPHRRLAPRRKARKKVSSTTVVGRP